MPRLSLYTPKKGYNYKFIDKAIWESFQIGGTDVLLHKYVGPGSSNPKESTPGMPYYENPDITNIQDLIFLENRNRKYDPDVYVMRGVYNVQDIDFNLSQFGLFLQNDNIYITFHINDTVERLGRKIVSGDVIELPHLKDEYATNDLAYALKRFYVIEDVNRAAEGFSVTWYPHLYRAKCKPLVDSEEFKDILDQGADDDNYKGEWNEDVTYYPDDIVKGRDGILYKVINPVENPYDPNATYYPGDVVDLDGVKYRVVEPSIDPWDRSKVYNEGDKVAAPDGTLYAVSEGIFDLTGKLPPNPDYYTKIPGWPITGEDPTNSDYFVPIDVPNDGITNIFPPQSLYYVLADSLRDVMSTYEKQMQITKAIMDQADYDTPLSGRDTTKFYTLVKDPDGGAMIVQASDDEIRASSERQATDEKGNLLFNDDGSPVMLNPTAATLFESAQRSGYDGYLYSGDGIPPNGAPFSAGISFPINPTKGQFFLRNDFFPHRLFRFDGSKWYKVEDNIRMTLNNLGETDVSSGIFEGKSVRQTQRGTFVNNTNTDVINGRVVKEKQGLSVALRPTADE